MVCANGLTSSSSSQRTVPTRWSQLSRVARGRIDQAIEFPLPDERLRRQLVALYARSLVLSPELLDDLAHRTDAASPAFIKEFLRRIAQHHLDSETQGNVTRATAEAALHEMLFSGGTLNTKLLGGEAVSNEALRRSM